MSGFALKVKLLPRSSMNKIVGFEGDILKVKVKSAPVDGLANQDLIILLSKRLRIPKERIEIISGHKSRSKTIRFHGIEKDDLFLLLNG
ncbi:MAG: DUF167 domain-containing protein [Desulfatiglandales bacterium]